ncbi:MAG: hypothetical protein WA364_20195 [Candidatus Nitrosopolaris sp.]
MKQKLKQGTNISSSEKAKYVSAFSSAEQQYMQLGCEAIDPDQGGSGEDR